MMERKVTRAVRELRSFAAACKSLNRGLGELFGEMEETMRQVHRVVTAKDQW